MIFLSQISKTHLGLTEIKKCAIVSFWNEQESNPKNNKQKRSDNRPTA
jgi:hypothetical protein